MNKQVKKRIESFEKEMVTLQEKFQIQLYPANCVIQNGEVVPMIKILDLKDKKDLMIK